MAPFLTDWRGRFTGRARAVLRPAGTARGRRSWSRPAPTARVPIVPQGGKHRPGAGQRARRQRQRRGAVAGAHEPHARASMPLNRTITVDAGCILQHVQDAAAAQGCLFPLSLAAEGSCTIGGNLSTNAGGTAVLRYGNTRELCLGLEVVTPQGEVWNGLRGLRKDNTGYDLRDLFIGAEGTLGVITGAVLKLFPQPKAALTALVAMASPRNALHLLTLMQDQLRRQPDRLRTDVRLLPAPGRDPLPRTCRSRSPRATRSMRCWKCRAANRNEHAVDLLERAIAAALDQRHRRRRRGGHLDGAVARRCGSCASTSRWRRRRPARTSSTTSRCRFRASPTSSTAPTPRCRPPSPAARWCASATWATATCTTTSRRPTACRTNAFLGNQDAVNRIVHDSVAALRRLDLGRTRHRRPQARRTGTLQGAVELDMMRAIKARARPARHHEPWQNLVNPGRTIMRRLIPAALLLALCCAARGAEALYKCTHRRQDRSIATRPARARSKAIAVPPAPRPAPADAGRGADLRAPAASWRPAGKGTPRARSRATRASELRRRRAPRQSAPALRQAAPAEQVGATKTRRQGGRLRQASAALKARRAVREAMAVECPA